MYKKKYPDAFQGSNSKKSYYEGWYNKIVDANSEHQFAFIPGIALNKKMQTSHSFIQFLDGTNASTKYFKYPLLNFQNLSKRRYSISVQNSFFSVNKLKIDIDQQGYRIKGILHYNNPILWPKQFLQPGIMGWLHYFPLLETYHCVVSMNHEIKGSLTINDKIIIFEKGSKGYIEKDWGTSFPYAYIWAQSNHFSDSNLSFMFSIAKIPFLGKIFDGFLGAIWHEGTFYKFASYTSAKVSSLKISAGAISIIVKDKKFSILFKLIKNKGGFTKLKSPESGTMSGHISESINSKIFLKLIDNKTRKIMIDDIGLNAGLDIVKAESLIPVKKIK